MKRLLCVLLSLFLLCACNGGGAAPVQGDPPKDDDPPETVDIDIWDVDPVYEYEDIDVSFTSPTFLYTEDYNNAQTVYSIEDVYNEQGVATHTGSYEKGGVMVYQNGYFGVMNRQGNLLFEPQFDGYIGPAGMLENTKLMTGCKLNKDYTLGECSDSFGVGWVSPGVGYLKEDGTVVDEYGGENRNIFDFYKEAVNAGYLSEGEKFLFRSESYEGATDYMKGYYLIGSDSLTPLLDDLQYHHVDFSNEVILFAKLSFEDVDYRARYTDYTYYDTNGNLIASGIEEGYGFYEGLAAVKKNGKWGYIDKTGECVTGYIFDKATPVSDGKAWVIYKGRTGRLNVLDIIENKLSFDETTLDTSKYEKVSDTSKWIEITADSINVREEPSTSTEIKATVSKGDVFCYFDKTEAGGYTWYQIGDRRWVADQDGEWIKEK